MKNSKLKIKIGPPRVNKYRIEYVDRTFNRVGVIDTVSGRELELTLLQYLSRNDVDVAMRVLDDYRMDKLNTVLVRYINGGDRKIIISNIY